MGEDGDGDDCGNVFLTAEQLTELSEAFAAMRQELAARNDTGILRLCRSCTEKVMGIVEASSEESMSLAESIQAEIVALNGTVMAVLKSSYDEDKVAEAESLLTELEHLVQL